MTVWLAGWRLALRIAAREAWRAKGRSAVVVVMILLPVLGVATADILIRTAQLSAVESVPRYLGSAAARVELLKGPLVQESVNPFDDPVYEARSRHGRPRPTLAGLGLGNRPSTPITVGNASINVTDGVTVGDIDLVDPRNPLVDGMFHLRSGHWPQNSDQVVINPWLAAHAPGVGQQITLRVAQEGSGRPETIHRTVVGIADSELRRRADVLVALPGSMPIPDSQFYGSRGYLVGGPPIPWSEVQRLNAQGALLFTRAVAADPPDLSQYSGGSTFNFAELSIVALIVVMALLEVVLLAGPALAVGAKRQSRTLALLATAGGTPAQGRRVVLGSGLVLGTVGAVVGIVLALPAARLLEPAAQRLSVAQLGPFDLRWRELLAIALLGVGSALLAAVVPAWIASRQDVVAVLAGRRGSRRPGLRSPLAGVALIVVGVLAAAEGTRMPSDAGAALIPFGTLLCVLGMILLVGVVVAGVARLGVRLPLPLRFAIRDADRHRTRMVPAVAAVAATVAGLTAVGIAVASYDAAQRAHYVPDLQIGQGAVVGGPTTPWPTVTTTIREQLDHPTITPVVGVTGKGEVSPRVSVGGRRVALMDVWRSAGSGGSVLVGASPALLPPLLSEAVSNAAVTTLQAGGAVVYASHREGAARGELTIRSGKTTLAHRTQVPIYFVRPVDQVVSWGEVVLAPALARRMALPSAEGGVLIDHTTIRGGTGTRLADSLRALPGEPSLEVENGWQARTFVRILELVLFLLGGFLVVGGTLTATYLSLADAGPDLATLAAVGAAGRTRRLVAAAYALAVSLLGAVLGALVGLVPGISIVHPINDTGLGGDLYVTLPWGLIALVVVGLPVAMALLVGLTTRGRLPMVARMQ